jgi:hypothetical protein
MIDAKPDAAMTNADILAKAEHIYCEFTMLMERLRAQARAESSSAQDDSQIE